MRCVHVYIYIVHSLTCGDEWKSKRSRVSYLVEMNFSRALRARKRECVWEKPRWGIGAARESALSMLIFFEVNRSEMVRERFLKQLCNARQRFECGYVKFRGDHGNNVRVYCNYGFISVVVELIHMVRKIYLLYSVRLSVLLCEKCNL